MSFLGLYRDPVVAKVTHHCDWRIHDLVEGDQPVSLYLVVPPSDISRTKPLVRLILNQVGRRTFLPDRALWPDAGADELAEELAGACTVHIKVRNALAPAANRRSVLSRDISAS